MLARYLAKSMLSLVALTARPIELSAQELVAKTYAEVGGWKVESYKSAGQHMRCGAIVPAAATISFEKSREGWTVLVPTRAKGDSLQGLIDVDGRTFRGLFYRMDDNRAGLFLKPQQLRMLRVGKIMNVRIGAEQTAISLTGAASAFGKLAECDEKGGP